MSYCGNNKTKLTKIKPIQTYAISLSLSFQNNLETDLEEATSLYKGIPSLENWNLP